MKTSPHAVHRQNWSSAFNSSASTCTNPPSITARSRSTLRHCHQPMITNEQRLHLSVRFRLLYVVLRREKSKYQSYYGPGRRPLAYLPYYNAYGKPRLPPVHKYSSLRSTAHCAAGPLHWTLGYTHCAGSEGSMSSFKSITWNELW